MSRSKKKRLLLRACGIVLALVMVLSNFTGLYPAMTAKAATCRIDVYTEGLEMGTVTGQGNYNSGNTVTLTAYPSPGYDFICWADYSLGEVYYDNPLKFTATESREIDVIFKKQGEYFIYVPSHEEGNVNISPAKSSYAPGETVYLSATVNANYVLDTFLLREDGTEQYTEIGNSFKMPSNDVYVSARFRSTIPHNITVDPSIQHGTFTLLDGKTSYKEGETVRLAVSPENGYVCKSISGIPANYTYSNEVYTFKMLRQDLYITGTFEKAKKYNVEVFASLVDGGTVDYTLSETNELTLSATANDGYVFVGYYDYTNNVAGELISTNANYTTRLTGDLKILAVFGKLVSIEYYVVPENSGTVDNYYDIESDQYFLTATANEGYIFQCWVALPDMSIISTDQTFSFVRGSYHKVVAYFKEKATSNLYLTMDTNHGSIGVVNYKSTYEEGEEIEITVTPDPGYILDKAYYGVLEDNTLKKAHIIEGNKFNMPGYDTWLYATFVRAYNVTATASLSAGGTVTGGGEYKSGETVTLKAKVNEGYDFINWTENGEEVSTEATYQFTASADRELVANFKKKVVVYKDHYFENFENWKAYEWTLVDYDGDGSNWSREEEIDYDVSGGWSLESIARMGFREYDPDNWAITPAIIAPEDARLSFWMYQYRTFRYKGTDTLGVYVGLSPDPNQMIKLKDFTIDTKADQSCQVNLSAYAGQKIYIGFRHYNSAKGITLYLDNIEVYGAGSALTDENLAIAKKSLTLYDTISIDFKVPKSAVANYHDPYLSVMQGNSKSKITRCSEDGDLLIFTYRVAPHMMGEPVIAVPHAFNANGEDVIGTALKYSVAEYCYNMLNKETYQEAQYATFRRLLVDILCYGDAAQVYAGYKTDGLAGAKLTAAQRAMGTDVSAEMNYQSVKDPEFAKVDNPMANIEKAALYLEAAVNIRFKFSVNEISNLRVVITDNEACTNVIAEHLINTSQIDINGLYYVNVGELNAGQMRKTVYATIMQGDQKVSNTYRYSIESYAESMKGNDDDLDNLLDAMMRYGDSAAAFARQN